MCTHIAESQKRSAKSSHFKEDDMALPLLVLLLYDCHCLKGLSFILRSELQTFLLLWPALSEQNFVVR